MEGGREIGDGWKVETLNNAYTVEISRRDKRGGVIGVAEGGGQMHRRSHIGHDIEHIVRVQRAGGRANVRGMRHGYAM
jgi:hypothetical protein